MTELEKITYAKTFIDKLANGINPLDDTLMPDGELLNNVRLSRCFFFVSDILRQVIENEIKAEEKKTKKTRKPKKTKLPFSITAEQLQNYVCSTVPISATAIAQKINWLVKDDITSSKKRKLSTRQITQWLLNIHLLELREWEQREYKTFPTKEGEAIGIISEMWEFYGKRTPIVRFKEEAQQFIIDNIDAVIATETRKKNNLQEDSVDDVESNETDNDNG